MQRTLIVLAVLATACGRGPKSAVPPDTPATVKVQNNNFSDMDVFVVRRGGGERIRLGMVMGGQTEVFTIPASLVPTPSQLIFETRPIGGASRPRATTFTVTPGDQITLLIPPT